MEPSSNPQRLVQQNDQLNRPGQQNANSQLQPNADNQPPQSDVRQYQNIGDLQSNELTADSQHYKVPNQHYQVPSQHYQVPKCSEVAQLKRAAFSQHTSRSFPIQSNQSKATNNACLRKDFQPNLALNKINKVNSHPLASESPTSSFTLNRTTSAQSKSLLQQRQLQPRYWRTQSTSSAISVQSTVSGSFVSNSSLANSLSNSQPPNNATSKFNRNKSSSIYSNTPPLPVAANSTLTKQAKRATRASLNYSMQSFKSNYLAPFAPEIELNGVESVTSSSYLHGFILIAIILLSITAFVLSKLQDACEDFFFNSANHSTCYPTSQFLFSSMLLFTSLFAFIVYFLHLVGQCDYLNLMAKRKVFTEILVTCLVIFCLLLSSLTLILTTVAIFNWINTVSLIIAFVVCVLYKVRIYLLFREYRMLADKPVDVCMEIGDFGHETNALNTQISQQISQQMSHPLTASQLSSQLSAQLSAQRIRRFSLQSNQQSKDDDDDEVFT